MADTIFNHVSVTITLQTSASPAVAYTQMFLCDSTDVPVDVRYRDTTRSGYTEDLTSTENTYKFAQAFWSQKRTADSLRLGRWISAATASHMIFSSATSTAATYAALTNTGQIGILEAGSAVVDINPNFTGVTTMAGVCAAIEAAMSGVVAAYTCALDILGRVVITSDNTGASAAAVSAQTPAAGVDLTGAAYLGTETSIAGYDAEEPTAAITAISAINDDYYDVAIRGESTTQQQALAAQIEGLRKQLTLVTGVADDKDPTSTTDVPYLLNALGYDNTMIMYTEHTITATGGWVDAAVQGACLPAEEGSTAWSFEALSGVYASGKDYASSPIALTAAEKTALEDKNCNWFETVGNDTYMYPGLNCSGEEKRIVLGRHWLENSMTADIASYKLNNALPAFDDPTLTGIERIIRQYLTEALARGIIIDTEARPITLDMPTADDFTAAQRASHTMTLSDVFNAYVNSVVNDVTITGELRI